MKKLPFFFLVFISAKSFAQLSVKSFEPLKQLKGSWESQRKKGMLTEQWTILNDSTMNGYSFIKTNNDSIPEEKVELVLRAGKIFYIAAAARQNDDKPVPFMLVKIENGKYFFENKQHDFPQRITYHLPDEQTLHAAIYGPMDGKEIEVLFNFKRTLVK